MNNPENPLTQPQNKVPLATPQNDRTGPWLPWIYYHTFFKLLVDNHPNHPNNHLVSSHSRTCNWKPIPIAMY